MLDTTQDTDWAKAVGRAAGALLLLSGILLSASMCLAGPRHDNPYNALGGGWLQ
jgi:hypothetical protein